MDSVQLSAPVCQAPAQEQKKKGISGSTVKIIAVVAMLIDHLAAALLTRILISNGMMDVLMSEDYGQIMQWVADNAVLYYGMSAMRMIGRLGFPIFCFLLVEGFQKTRNIRKYVFRLGLFALISEIPFDLACSGKVLEFGYQNVYFTLFIGILSLCAFDFFAKHDVHKALRVILQFAGKSFCAVWRKPCISAGRTRKGYGTAGGSVYCFCHCHGDYLCCVPSCEGE